MTLPAQIAPDASLGPAATRSQLASQTHPQGRQHWIDWLRVGAIAGVFVFHTLRAFNTDDWHVKNAETSAALNEVTMFFTSFGLAVLFLLAGAGTRFALRKRTWQAFLRERTLRLIVPFVIGTLLLSPFQAYLEAVHKNGFAGSYLEFAGTWLADLPGRLTERAAPTVFGVGYHLWFLGFLFAISVLALPLCRWLLGARGEALLDALARHATWRGATLAGVVPVYLLMAIGMALGTAEHDWFELAWYFGYFVLGFVLLPDPRFIVAIRRDRWLALGLALTSSALVLARIPAPLQTVGQEGGPVVWLTLGAIFAIEGWAWTIVMVNVGLAIPALQRPVRERIGDAVLPVYVIHQPVILAVAFVMVGWPIGILPKWIAVFGLSLAITLVLVELALRSPLIRVLLGTRVRPPASDEPPTPAAVMPRRPTVRAHDGRAG